MNAYAAFALWWGITNVLALPSIITYLVLDLRKISISLRLLLKVSPVLIFCMSLLLGLAVGIAQRTPYTGLIVSFLLLCAFGDAFLCSSDFHTEQRDKKEAFVWKILGVIAFALSHIVLIVAFCLSPQLSAGLDDGSAAPWALLILIPFAFSYVLLIAFAIYMQRMAPAELLGVGLYTLLLLTAAWRAAARVNVDTKEQYLSAQIVCLVGVVLFGVSDLCILVNAYFAPSKYSKLWVMPLYWVGTSGVFFSSFLFK